jgi:DnaJ-class molecular chaperone
LDRQWLKIRHEWDIKAAYGKYEKIARASLAHWLQGECEECRGTKISNARACSHCAGTGREPIKGGVLDVEYIKDMVSELESLYQSYCARAGAKMRNKG